MEKLLKQVRFKAFTDEMLEFFKNNPTLGTEKNPIPADAFVDLVKDGLVFTGPLKNILQFEENSDYVFEVESPKGILLEFDSGKGKSKMILSMITDQPSEEKWKKFMKNPPKMNAKGEIELTSTDEKKSKFEFVTNPESDEECKIKYSLLFGFNTAGGETKFALIDPYADGGTRPPAP
jgi:hypothetical protein